MGFMGIFRDLLIYYMGMTTYRLVDIGLNQMTLKGIKGSETLKIPVYTLIPRHPDLQLQKQALLMKQ